MTALLFFRFWRQSVDGFFLLLSFGFLILTVDYAVLGLISVTTEWHVYVLRLAAFTFLLIAISIRNRR